MIIIILLLTVIVICIEVYIWIRINKIYTSSVNSFPTEDNFEYYINEEEIWENYFNGKKLSDWIFLIKYNIRNNSTLESFDDLLNKPFIDPQDQIKFYSNLGPAWGLIFTFIGMGFTLFTIKFGGNLVANEAIKDVRNAIFNLFPIFAGSFLGILVYIIGNSKVRKFESFIRSRTEKFKISCLNLVRDIRYKKPRDINEAIQQLFDSISQLKNELLSIKRSFSGFSKSLEINNSKFEENITNINSITNDFLSKINDNANNLIESNTQLTESVSTHNEASVNTIKSAEIFQKTVELSTSSLSEMIDNGNHFNLAIKDSKNVFKSLVGSSVELANTSTAILSNNSETTKLIKQFEKFVLTLSNLLDKQIEIKDIFKKYEEDIPKDLLVELSLSLNQIYDKIPGEEKISKNFDNIISELTPKIENSIDKSIGNLLNQQIEIKDILKRYEEDIPKDLLVELSLSLNQIYDKIPGEEKISKNFDNIISELTPKIENSIDKSIGKINTRVEKKVTEKSTKNTNPGIFSRVKNYIIRK